MLRCGVCLLFQTERLQGMGRKIPESMKSDLKKSEAVWKKAANILLHLVLLLVLFPFHQWRY
jgi:hypothetical protein